MGTTALGFPYPEGTDLVMDGDDAMEALAAALDLAHPLSGQVTVPSPGSNRDGSLTVTFPVGRFATAPAVIVTPNTGAPTNVVASVTGVTTSACTVIANRADSGTATVVHVVVTPHTAVPVGGPLAAPRALGADDLDVAAIGDEPALIEVTVTCPTEGCPNQDFPISVQMLEGGAVMCGVCGTHLEPVEEAS